MIDYAPTVMRQYANSPFLRGLLDAFRDWVDPEKFTNDFFREVWNIASARGYGLDVWGRILGRDRYLRVPQVPGDNFGFNIGSQPGTNWKPFNQAPFFDRSSDATVSFRLEDEAYRQLLLVKAAANIARCDPPSLNALLRGMFGREQRAFVSYDLATPMRLVYHFEFYPTPVERAIVESGVFPKPAGMDVTFLFRTLSYNPFGFAGSNAGADPTYVTGFDQGPFYDK